MGDRHRKQSLKHLRLTLFSLFNQILFIFGLATFIVLSSQYAKAMGLKQNSVVRDNMITLGDIFYDLPKHENKVLGPAPRPGQDMVLNARTLLRIALTLDLPWRPANSDEYIVLKRAATLIKADTVKDRLKKAIAEKGYPGKFDLTIPGPAPDLIMPETTPATFEITALELDPAKGKFSADIRAPDSSNPIITTRISGTIDQIVQVPVLKETLRHGTIIRQSDIEMVDVKSRLVKGDVLLNPESLVSMTPRRITFAGEPILSNEIEAPKIVHRGESVIMIFRHGGLVLTAQGKALENGGKGQVVRVVNNSSNRSIDAIVTAENEVRVGSF